MTPLFSVSRDTTHTTWTVDLKGSELSWSCQHTSTFTLTLTMVCCLLTMRVRPF